MICRTKAELTAEFAKASEMIAAGKKVSVTVKEFDKRSLDQNALFHTWMQQAAIEDSQDDALGWKCYAKLHFGVPILRAEDDDFRRFYDGAIKGLTYEQKKEAMKIIPVTSLMKTAQMSKFMDEVQRDFAKRNVILEAA